MASNPNSDRIRGYFHISVGPLTAENRMDPSRYVDAANCLMKSQDFQNGYLIRADVMDDYDARHIIAPFVATNVDNLQTEVVDALSVCLSDFTILIARDAVTEYNSPEVGGKPNHNPDDGSNGPRGVEPEDIEEEIIIGGSSNHWG